MKTSGNKLMMMVSALIIGSTLFVPVLLAEHYCINEESRLEECNTIEIKEVFKNTNAMADFSVGRELSIRL